MYSEGDAGTGVDFTSAGLAKGNTQMLLKELLPLMAWHRGTS